MLKIIKGTQAGLQSYFWGDRLIATRHGAPETAAGKLHFGNIEVGEYSRVGASSVVLQSVPPGCTAVGVPAMAAISLKHRPKALWPIFSGAVPGVK